jgi:hypothetical protein
MFFPIAGPLKCQFNARFLIQFLSLSVVPIPFEVQIVTTDVKDLAEESQTICNCVDRQ